MTASLSVAALAAGFHSPIHRPMRTAAVAAVAAPSVASPTSSRTLYEVLRVKQTASAAEIKAAYRSLAKRFHPDATVGSSSRGSGEDFVDINRAYATLSDPSARTQYDLSIGRLGLAGVAWSRSRRWETDQCW